MQITKREFLKQLGLGAAGLAGGSALAAGLAALNGTTPRALDRTLLGKTLVKQGVCV